MELIETERLLLRGWQVDDVYDFFDYAKNPNVGPHGGWKPHENVAESMDILQNLFLEKYQCWAIVFKENNKVIGAIGYETDLKRPEICCKELGYSLSEDYWGRGLMTEAAKAVISFGFRNMELEMISIYRSPWNERSKRVMDKCGFTYEGTLRKANKIYDGSIRDVACYSMMKEEYEYHERKNQE